MRNDFRNGYLEHWGLKKGAKAAKHKYIARAELSNGKYRYFYTLREWLAYLKENKEKITEDKINESVKKAEDYYNNTLDKNKYLTDDYNYDKKIKEVQKNKEWQDIVKRKDPEYVKRDKETGEYKYDIDSYLAKKKHPGLDVADDIVSGRKVTINKVEKEAAIAGAVDYAKTYLTLAAVGTKFLLEKFKFSQGSYKDEKQEAIDYYNENKEKIVKNAGTASTMLTNENAQKVISSGEEYINQVLASESVSQATVVTDKYMNEIKSEVSAEEYAQMKKEYEAMQKELEKYKK